MKTTARIGLDAQLSGANPEQQRVYDLIAQGPRGTVPRPFLAMLDRPALAEAIQQVGATIRFSGILADAQRELAILATAGAVGCGYEWQYHAPIAETAGLQRLAIQATLDETLIPRVAASDALIIRLCRSVALTRSAPDTVLDDAIASLGRAETAELIAIAGYYGLLASFIIIGGHDVPLPSGR